MKKTQLDITYKEVSLKVFGIYTRKIPEIRYDFNGGSPYEPATFEVQEVFAGNGKEDIFNLFNEEQIIEIEELCLKEF
jgi:hypothetical protein